MIRIVLLYLFLVLISCNNTASHKANNKVKSTTQVEYAHYFQLIQKGGKTVLEITHPDSKKTITLNPLVDNKKIIALSGTSIGMMSKLNLENWIVGVQDMKYVYNPGVKQNFQQHKVIETNMGGQMQLESIIQIKPKMIFYNGFNNKFPHQTQFQKVGIDCIPIYDWREKEPLGKAEWIKVYGFLYGKLDKATQLFEEIKKDYLQTKEQAKHLKTSKTLMSGNIYGGTWYCPAGESFFAQLMKDANISYAYYSEKGTGSVAFTLEKILKDNQQASIWINPGVASLNDLLGINPKAKLFESFQNGQVFDHMHHENFYWEVSSIEPAKLLNDLIIISHPEFQTSDSLYFYKKLN